LSPTIDERQRRLWAGEAGAGFGGVAAVARATGLAISTVRKGRDEGRAGAKRGDVVNVCGSGQAASRGAAPRRVTGPGESGDARRSESALRWRRKSAPVELFTTFRRTRSTAIPYGVYDIAATAGFISVGVDDDTPVRGHQNRGVVEASRILAILERARCSSPPTLARR
jgi:hypothetical protein